MDKNEIRQFITFLKKNDAYSAYRHNIKTPHYPREKDNELAKLVNRFDGKCGQLIGYSFTWIMTKEGHDYWHHLHLGWLTVSRGIKKL